ncbi:MAG: cation diffusion facilitator family transporter [Xanthobacteraceae bacterium]
MANPSCAPYIVAMQDHVHDHHDHGGANHSHAPKGFSRAFAIGTALNLLFVVAEIVFGFASNSLALLSDAAHNFSDVLGLLLAWGATWLAQRPPTATRTYGYRSASILAALANAGLLLVATGAIFLEALQRFADPHAVDSGTVIWVAAVGIIINSATALMFMRGREHDLNINGAFLHMAADAGVSLGVVIAAMLIMWTGWLWLDPAISLVIGMVIFWSCWSLMRDALNLALHAVPERVDPGAVEAYLCGLPGVAEVHDLHIWAMSTTETALTAHLVRPDAASNDNLLHDAAHELQHRFGIQHATLQIESGEHECRLAPAHVV